MPSSRTLRRLLRAGVVGPILFAVTVVLQDATRPGFDPLRHWVSHLSLGPGGWVNVVNLMVFGVLTWLFAVGLWRLAGRGAGLVALLGTGLVLAGAFVSDPAPGYPPRAVAQTADASLEGSVHDLAGLLTFASAAAAALVVPRRLGRAPGWAGWARWSRRAGVAIAVLFLTCSVMAALDYGGVVPGAPSGLFERLALGCVCAWLAATAWRCLHPPEGT